MNKIENTLNLTPNRKPTKVNPILHRRNTLVKHLNRQLKLVSEFKSGIKVKNVWFWNDEEGNYYLPIKYGKTDIELSKNKFSILCKSIDEIETNLEKVKTMTLQGSLDSILTEVGKNLRSKFKK
tara:strand:- start:1741 stop:2112 length:372 start_codon:yes stop_codon:yes gene_type:complete